MNSLITLIAALWLGRILLNLASYINLWQVKEYRFDRMFIHLGTSEGKRFLIIPFRRPPFSPKTSALTISLVVLILLLLSRLSLPLLLRLLLIDLSLFPLTFVFVGIFGLPTFIYHRIKINQAAIKLRNHKPLTVIGITGSYGKTSTKEYLATILENKYKVLKTAASKNSAIGIAEVILPKLTPEHEVFIVEMGAYKRGEIAAMSEMVKPEIAAITAINPQHQDLFGTIETTMKAKYEIIEGLTGRRIAIFNADNEYVRQMARWAKRDRVAVWSVGRESNKISEAKQYFTIKNLEGNSKEISFSFSFGKEKDEVTAPVLGEHQATNISLAIAAAVAAGLPFRQAVKRAQLVKSVPKNMEPKAGTAGALFIDDTFNNNPAAAIAAIDFMSKIKGRKILVFQPMIELGSFTKVSHEKVGQRAAQVCDDIILTNHNFLADFLIGVKKVSPKKPVQVLSPKPAAAFIRQRVSAGDVVLFKGKEAEQALRLLS